MIIGETSYQAYGGMAAIEGLTFIGNPGSTFKFSFDGSGIDSSKSEAKKTQSATANSTTNNTSIYVELRECELGEQFTA